MREQRVGDRPRDGPLDQRGETLALPVGDDELLLMREDEILAVIEG